MQKIPAHPGFWQGNYRERFSCTLRGLTSRPRKWLASQLNIKDSTFDNYLRAELGQGEIKASQIMRLMDLVDVDDADAIINTLIPPKYKRIRLMPTHREMRRVIDGNPDMTTTTILAVRSKLKVFFREIYRFTNAALVRRGKG